MTVARKVLLVLAMWCLSARAAFPVIVQAKEAPEQGAVLLPIRVGLFPVPLPRLESLEEPVRRQIVSFQQSLSAPGVGSSLVDSELAETYGILGQLYHTY